MESSNRCAGVELSGTRCSLSSVDRSAYCSYHLPRPNIKNRLEVKSRQKSNPMAKLKISVPVEECSICLDITNEPLYILKCCQNTSHFSCLEKLMKPECPFCRAPLDIFSTATRNEMIQRETRVVREYQNDFPDGFPEMMVIPIGPIDFLRLLLPDAYVHSPHPPHPLMNVAGTHHGEINPRLAPIHGDSSHDPESEIEEVYVHMMPYPHLHVRRSSSRSSQSSRIPHVRPIVTAPSRPIVMPPVRPISIVPVRPTPTGSIPGVRTDVTLSTNVPSNSTLPVLPGLSANPLQYSPPHVRPVEQRVRTNRHHQRRMPGMPHLDNLLTDTIMNLVQYINDPTDNRQIEEKLTGFINNMASAGMSSDIIAETIAFAGTLFD